MEYATTLLWVLGLAFLTLAWLGIVLSVSLMVRGFVGRAIDLERRRESVPLAKRPLGVWARGLIAGAIGYAVTVVFYIALNLAQSRNAFFTPNALGRSLLGVSGPGEDLDVGLLLVYNGLHLVVFLALGLAAAWLIRESGRHPKIWYLGLVLALAVFFHLVGIVLMLAAPSGGAVPAWSVVTASAAAALAMGVYLLVSQPQILRAVRLADLES
jgi:hypothetical protein